MDPTLQRHCAKYIYIVPHGLRELMSDISREVMRALPENMYTFIADYLDAMMITRENARVAIRLIDEISDIAATVVELLNRTGLSREVVDQIARVIQRFFREYLERKRMAEHPEEYGEGYDEVDAFTHKILSEINIDYDKLVEVTIIIQNAYRRFKERREREKVALFGMIDWRIAAASTIRLYRRTGVTRYEADRAATLIKAAYKGYYTRRIMKRLLHSALDDQTTIDLSMETDTIPESTTTLEEQLALGESLIETAEVDEEKAEQTEVSETNYDEISGEVLIELKTETLVPAEGVELGGGAPDGEEEEDGGMPREEAEGEEPSVAALEEGEAEEAAPPGDAPAPPAEEGEAPAPAEADPSKVEGEAAAAPEAPAAESAPPAEEEAKEE